jgi:hypothetical protein
MSEYKATWTGFANKKQPPGVQGYVTPKDRAFNLYANGTPVLGNVRSAIREHEKSVFWWAAVKAATPCEKPFLLRRDLSTSGEPEYEEIEVSCFEFIVLHSHDRKRIEPYIGLLEDRMPYEHCGVCKVAREIFEGIKA